jgi:hypothetical protein
MIHLILVLAICGFAAWLVLQVPMPTIFRNVIFGIMVILLVIWTLQTLGVNTGFPRIG